MSEQNPSHDVEGIIRRAQRLDCVEAQIWGRVEHEYFLNVLYVVHEYFLNVLYVDHEYFLNVLYVHGVVHVCS